MSAGASFRSLWCGAIRPAAYSAFGLFTSSTLSRPSSTLATAARCTKFLVRPPSKYAPRECPTPLIFLKAKGMESLEFEGKEGDESWATWAGMFAEKGFTAVEVDIEPPAQATSPGNFVKAMTSELSHQLRLLAIPFPPVLITSQASTLLSQAYISDFPASGIVLLSPPTQNEVNLASTTIESDSVSSQSKNTLTLPEFTFEPRFPILVVSPTSLAQTLEEGHRLVRDFAPQGVGRGGKGVEVEVGEDNLTSHKNRIIVERWLDRCGF